MCVYVCAMHTVRVCEGVDIYYTIINSYFNYKYSIYAIDSNYSCNVRNNTPL